MPLLFIGVALVAGLTGLHYFGAWGAFAGAMSFTALMVISASVSIFREWRGPRLSRSERRYVKEIEARDDERRG